jgi:cobalt-zinc-cadmium efflux system outer membrane protein
MRRRHFTHVAETAIVRSILLPVATLAACTSVSVPPAPIEPAATAAMLTARSLQAPEIAAALAKVGGSTAAGWNIDALTVAAWTLRSDVAVAAADINTGLSAERVAGLRPNPTLNFDQSSFVTNYLQDPTVWVFSTALNFTIETGDKREIRVAQARADTETRRWRLAELLWQTRAELRRALVARDLAQRNVALSEAEIVLRQDFLDWVETQIRFGVGVGSERLNAQTNLVRAQAQLRAARGDLATAEAQIAAAAGIAIENLPLGQLMPVVTDTLPTPESYDLGMLRDMAIVNRLTVRHALADYAVTEQALRQAVARQYPDINLGPGYTYDRGDHAITVAASAIIPLLHDESDAIAQAVNVRTAAAAQFQQAQSLALGEVDTATARYRAAYAPLVDAKNAEDLAVSSVEEVQRRLSAGGADRGEVLTAQINLALAQRASYDALKLAVDALGALEDSVQRPVWPPSALSVQRPDTASPE